MMDDSFSPERFRDSGHNVVNALADYLEAAQSGKMPVLPIEDPDALLDKWRLDNKEAPRQLVELIQEVLQCATHLHHPGYVGHQVAVPLPAAALIECLNALLNNGMAVYEMGQIQSVMERAVVETLCQLVGFKGDAGGILTHGGSLGNFTALLAARQAKAGYDIWNEGQRRPMCVLVSDQAHYCISRSVQSMGWGKKGAWPVKTNQRLQMDMSSLRETYQVARRENIDVIAVVGSACSTASGSFDPLAEVGDFCREHDLWFHVDGAHGASLAMSAKHRHKIEGLESADSVVWDLHKMLGLPALNTALLFREKRRSYEAFAQEASYLFDQTDPEEQWFNLAQRTMECTKRAMGTTAWCLFRVLGLKWFESHVDRLIATAESFSKKIEASDDFEVAHQPQANILCFRHVPDRLLSQRALDDHQSKIRDLTNEEGSFYLVQTQLLGATWLRVTFMNPLTQPHDLDQLLLCLRRAAEQLDSTG